MYLFFFFKKNMIRIVERLRRHVSYSAFTKVSLFFHKNLL